MDLLTSITGAQTYRAAIQQVQERTGLDREGAWKEIGRVVTESGWALLVAPELYLCLCAWWRVQRLGEDLEDLRATRDRLVKGIQEPRVMVVVETRSGKVVARPEGLIGETKVGPDLLSRRADSHANVENAITKKEEAQARAETAFRRAVEAYQASLVDIAALPPQAIAARLLTGSWRAQDMATCRALLEVAARPEDASGDETMAALAKHPALTATKEGR